MLRTLAAVACLAAWVGVCAAAVGGVLALDGAWKLLGLSGHEPDRR